jgi:hypothetical protein
MKPIPLGSFVPPVTGTKGRPGAVASNLFDTSGNFRDRTASFKRRRTGGDRDMDDAFDISRSYPPLSYPPKPLFDVESIQALMVDATSKAEFIKAMMDDPNNDNNARQFAASNLAMFALLTAVVEKAIIPLANSPPPTWNRQHSDAPPVAPKPDPGKKLLSDALAAAERTAIIFDADLGTASVGNKDRLAHAFSATVRAKAIAVAEETEGTEEEIAKITAEAVRVADDALSCASNMSFLGQATKQYTNSRDASDPRNGSFFTMPIKFEFPDKSSRIHFERTLREKCKLKAAMSLPLGIRKEADKCRNLAKEKFPGEIVMIRAESDGLQFAVFHKKDGDVKWIRSPDSYPIPVSAVLPDNGGGVEGMES